MKAKDKYSDNSRLWERRYEVASENQEPRFRKIAGWYDTYYASINTKNYAPWRSKVYIPVLATKTRNLIAKFIGLQPGFEVNVRNHDAEEDIQEIADKAQKKLEYDYDNPCFDEPMREKLFSPLMDAVIGGLGIAKTPWIKKTQTSYKRPIDELSGKVDLSKEQVTDTETGYNDLVPVNVFNFFYDPGAKSLQGAAWLMIREFKSYSDLININEANGGKLYKNLDTIKEMSAGSDKWAQYNKSRDRIQNTSDPIADDDTLDQIEIFECYEKSSNTITTFAVGQSKDNKEKSWVEIRRQKNPYWHRRYPLVPFYILRRPYQLWGQGIFEDTERLQAATNDVFNHFLDNVNLSIDGMLLVNENSDVDDYVVEPGGLIYYQGQVKPEQFKFPDPNPNIFNTVFQTIEGAIESATISQYATGVPNSSTDKTSGTATGIMRLQEAAGDMVGFMRSNFQTSIRTVGQHWLSNNQQFMAAPLTLLGSKSGRKEAITINPEDLQYEMDLRIDDASMQPTSKQDKLQQEVAYQDRVLQLQQASFQQAQMAGTKPLILNFQELFEETSDAFGKKNTDKVIMSEDEVQEAAMEQQQQMMEQQQGQMAEQQQMMEQEQQAKMMEQAAPYDEEISQDAAHMQAAGLLEPEEEEMMY